MGIQMRETENGWVIDWQVHGHAGTFLTRDPAKAIAQLLLAKQTAEQEERGTGIFPDLDRRGFVSPFDERLS